MESVVRLFRALPIDARVSVSRKATKSLLKETIGKGFIFSPEVISHYSEHTLLSLIPTISKEIGLSANKMNAAFHKSWKKVATADIEELIMEQICHYITTYGYESLGIYDESTVYIPLEKLDIPKLDTDKMFLVVIKGYTKEELKGKLITLLGSGIALKEDTKKDVIDVATYVGITEKEVSEIKNKEVRAALYDYLGMVPENPIEFLRFMIYKSTNKTLLIKNDALIKEIKSKDNLGSLGLLERYGSKHGFEKLAEIFYRFRPLWLAFRTSKKLKIIINRIRKLAIKYHKPMPEDYLNTITSRIKDLTIKESTLKEKLGKVNIFRKIRLAYALKFRTGKAESILYRIRNGKSYAKGFSFNQQVSAKMVLDIVKESIINDIKPAVEGKKIYIPSHIIYALPATEKQFTGDFPSGTCISIPKDMVFGIHWENVEENRIDLDLSLITVEGNKIGWDGWYRNAEKTILFSGDVTDAPKDKGGASELFYVKRQVDTNAILMVNYFNFDETIEVPFKILVAKELVKDFDRNYMVNPNNVVGVTKTNIKEGRQKVLGIISVTKDVCKFYFAETYLGDSITSYGNDYSNHARQYLLDFYSNMISLNEVLEEAGANLVTNAEKCDIDLSPEKLEKDTIIQLLVEGKRK